MSAAKTAAHLTEGRAALAKATSYSGTAYGPAGTHHSMGKALSEDEARALRGYVDALVGVVEAALALDYRIPTSVAWYEAYDELAAALEPFSAQASEASGASGSRGGAGTE